MAHSDEPIGNGASGSTTKRNGSGRQKSPEKHTIEIRLPRESLDLQFQVASDVTDSACKLIAFLSPKGGSGKTVLGTNLGKILQSSGYNVLLLDADFTTKSLTNLIFPGRKVIAEGLTSYYKALLGLDGLEIDRWLEGLENSVLCIDRSPEGKTIDILPSYYSKEQQSNINNSLFLREYRSHNLSYVVERFSQLLANLKALERYDYIIIDCASAFDDIGLAAAILAPFVVVASEVDDISFEAMDETLGYTISFAMSNTQDGDYNIKQPFIALNKDPHLRPGEKTSRRAAFHCKYIPDIHKAFGKKSFLVPDLIDDVEFEYQLYRLWRRISEWSTNPDATFTEAAFRRVLQLDKIRNQQIERYWNADLQYRKRNVMFGLTVLLITSLWVGIFGYLKPPMTAMTAAASGFGLFISSVILYRVWDYFERGIRALKQELYIDVHESSEDHSHFVHGLGSLVKARDNEAKSEDVKENGHAVSQSLKSDEEQESVPAD